MQLMTKMLNCSLVHDNYRRFIMGGWTQIHEGGA